jgi:hypothetical protein
VSLVVDDTCVGRRPDWIAAAISSSKSTMHRGFGRVGDEGDKPALAVRVRLLVDLSELSAGV